MAEKTKKKKITLSQFQWKVFRFLTITLMVVLILAGMIRSAVKDERNIAAKIGFSESIGISVKDALHIKEYCITPYVEYLKAGEFNEAYDMLSEEYRNYVSYEMYLKTIEGIDFETFEMASVEARTQGTYIAQIVYTQNGKEIEEEYLLFVNMNNSKLITISPNRFVYSYQDLNFQQDGIELTLNECVIYTDHIKMEAIIKNKSLFKDMKFNYISVGYGKTINKAEEIDLTLAPGEQKVIEIEYETAYYVPNNIKIKRVMDEETIRTYTFYFENSKEE